ncbi:MAG: 50S ribosome-binding GTPase [Marinobacter sp.]|uniref:GTPase n=1 Tax=Marinobacter sp. TaxID=50741 RepID=UPI001B515B66|nr:GTPase [Marinobacter sp.]MBQ0747665.1 50S ribosome-binding GTPase [Marinobacter sp.]MBQ0815122.1 50S ribosome-binding GTPase [Marinobacter sp.]
MSKAAIAEFMAHLVIADEHIHSDQIAMLRDFIDTYGLGNNQKDIFAVLEGKGDKHFPELLEQLKHLSPEDKDILIQNAAAIIGFNRHFAKEEKIAIARLCKATGIDPAKIIGAVENIISEAKKANEEKVNVDRSLDDFGELSLKVRRFFATGAKREYLSSKIRQNELSGPEYADAIKLTNRIAEVDCQLVETQLQNCSSALEETRKQVRHNLRASKPSSDAPTEEETGFHDFLKDLAVSLDAQARDSLAEIQEIIDKKRRAKNAFTIALMGRTKAGKSTLHYVMTGEGKDFIGVGAERTTRFNRVYEWENLKIIDTPGIGAAEAGGRTDEEIALSVVDTADVICYVVTNDSVQEVEFKFLSKIRDSNKPVFILLNCKENLQSPPPKYKKFLKDPLHWYNRSDEHNLQGIINRIESGVATYYDGGSVAVIPVHLMAAKMAREERYEKDRGTLDAGSRMNAFFNEVRENVIELGQLRKSQTLLDNTACRLAAMAREVSQKRQTSLRLADDIQSKLTKLRQQVKERTEKNQVSFLRELRSIVEHERSLALEFASENYKLKQKEIERYWKKEADRVSAEIQEKLSTQVKKASDEVQSYVTEAIEDISIGADYNVNVGFGDYSTFNTRRLTSVLGVLISTGGSIALIVAGVTNPWGWAAIGVGALISIGSGFMTSKEEKKRKAVQHMKTQVDKSLKSLEDEYKKHARTVFSEFRKKMDEAIESTILKVSMQYRSSAEVVVTYLDSLNSAIDKLNRQFAIRIIEFTREESILEGLGEESYPAVNRQLGQRIEISTHLPVPNDRILRAEQALKEKIVVKNLPGAIS